MFQIEQVQSPAQRLVVFGDKILPARATPPHVFGENGENVAQVLALDCSRRLSVDAKTPNTKHAALACPPRRKSAISGAAAASKESLSAQRPLRPPKLTPAAQSSQRGD